LEGTTEARAQGAPGHLRDLAHVAQEAEPAVGQALEECGLGRRTEARRRGPARRIGIVRARRGRGIAGGLPRRARCVSRAAHCPTTWKLATKRRNSSWLEGSAATSAMRKKSYT